MAGPPGLRRPLNRYVFNVRAEQMEEFRAMLNLANIYGLRRVGFLYSGSEVGRTHLENVRRIGAEFGMQLVLPAGASGVTYSLHRLPPIRSDAGQFVPAGPGPADRTGWTSLHPHAG